MTLVSILLGVLVGAAIVAFGLLWVRQKRTEEDLFVLRQQAGASLIQLEFLSRTRDQTGRYMVSARASSPSLTGTRPLN